MLKKRLIGVITVRNGWAVQSFGFSRYLPLGRPEVLAQNLNRWGADEILVQCIDRSTYGLGPDLEVMKKISKLGIATPLIYAGGISTRDEAVMVVSHGADRIMLGAMLLDNPRLLDGIARVLGTQAVIAHLAARITDEGFMALDYRNRSEQPLAQLVKKLPLEWVSELMVADWLSEGLPARFEERLTDLTRVVGKPLICFGGISEISQIQRILACPQVVAVGIGNFLNYKEHAVQSLKRLLGVSNVRPPYYENRLWTA
jgi:cyclase